MFIAAAQTRSSETPADNLEKARATINTAARRGADLIVFPEVFMAYVPEQAGLQAKRAASQTLDGPFVRGLAQAARDAGVWVVSGMIETPTDADPRVYNTTVVLDDRGELVARYRKTHLYDAFGFMESETFAPGDALFDPIETPWGRMGLFVCYELRFPEVARHQAERGVDFFIVPSGWVNGPMKELHWRSLVLARAIENTAYLVACDQVHNVFLGRSLIVDPMGVVLAEGSETECVLYADLNAERVANVRARVPSVANRRAELYRPALAGLASH